MNPSSEREAMPCPFCGGEPMSNPVESMFHTFRIVCPHCEMCGPERMTASEAIAAWQGRTAISTQPQQATAEESSVVGRKLVPVEPTSEMLDRAVAFALCVSLSKDYGWSEYMRDVWLRMLSAVPGQEGVANADQT